LRTKRVVFGVHFSGEVFMRTALAVASTFAFTLSVGLLPAKGQSFSDNYSSAAYPAQTPLFAPFSPFGTVPHMHQGGRGGSVSRACLTAQTRAVLAQLEGRFGGVRVISTCRPGATIAGTGRPSMHRYGRAVDFVPAPGQRAAMMSWLRAHAGGSVITYRSGHVHFDTGRYGSVAYAQNGARRGYARWR
jgi:hypothetical protein